MSVNVDFSLSFKGNDADRHLLDFYDAADALTGFQRSLALTVHLALNGELITHAPSLKGAQILIKSPEAGSWKVIATVSMLLSGAHMLGTASRDSVYGHIATSLYDYVINESLGFHVDFESTLGRQYEELKERQRSEIPRITQSQADSLIEKVENSIKEMHRPLHASGTATSAEVSAKFKRKVSNLCTLDEETYDYIQFTTQKEKINLLSGKVSSYNINTYKGRIFTIGEDRPIPFHLAEGARNSSVIQKITQSLSLNASNRRSDKAIINFSAFRFESNSGRLKRLLVTEVDREVNS